MILAQIVLLQIYEWHAIISIIKFQKDKKCEEIYYIYNSLGKNVYFTGNQVHYFQKEIKMKKKFIVGAVIYSFCVLCMQIVAFLDPE